HYFRSLSPSSVASGRPVLCRFLAVFFLLLSARFIGPPIELRNCSIEEKGYETAVVTHRQSTLILNWTILMLFVSPVKFTKMNSGTVKFLISFLMLS
ncbi:hypothetical protein L9F63_006198, partial [Diploptera punctata]